MYYCIVCKRIHDESVSMQSFGSGFRTQINGATITIGVCKASHLNNQRMIANPKEKQ